MALERLQIQEELKYQIYSIREIYEVTLDLDQ